MGKASKTHTLFWLFAIGALLAACGSQPSGHPVKAGLIADAHAMVRLEVRDTGIDMNLETLRRIRTFQPSTEADSSTTQRFGGTGLGLAISHGFVELMQGKLHVDNQEQEGTRVWFSVALDRCE